MLVIPSDELQSIHEHAKRDDPRECCGLLLGTSGEGTRQVVEARPTRNVNREDPTTRHDVSPEDQLQAVHDARDAGLEVVGSYHSHPGHPARASERDTRFAWRDASFVIVSVRDGVVKDTRSFELRESVLEEEEIRVSDRSG